MTRPSRLAINSSSQGSLSLQRACAANLTALAFGTAFSYATKMAKHLRSSERIRSHQHHIRTASARYTFQLLLYANLQSKSLLRMPPCEHALHMILVLYLHTPCGWQVKVRKDSQQATAEIRDGNANFKKVQSCLGLIQSLLFMQLCLTCSLDTLPTWPPCMDSAIPAPLQAPPSRQRQVEAQSASSNLKNRKSLEWILVEKKTKTMSNMDAKGSMRKVVRVTISRTMRCEEDFRLSASSFMPYTQT